VKLLDGKLVETGFPEKTSIILKLSLSSRFLKNQHKKCFKVECLKITTDKHNVIRKLSSDWQRLPLSCCKMA